MDSILLLGGALPAESQAVSRALSGLPVMLVQREPSGKTWDQVTQLGRVLAERGGFRLPLLWIEDASLHRVASRRSSPLKVFAPLSEAVDAADLSAILAVVDRVVAPTPSFERRLEDLGFSGEVVSRSAPGWLATALEPVKNQSDSDQPLANVLVLHSATELYTNTVVEHLQSFRLCPNARVFYAPASHSARSGLDIELFDAVIVHYSLRLTSEGYLAPSYARALAAYGGLKVLFLQDEYEATENVRRFIERLGIHVLFSCVPQESWAQVYPAARFPWLQIEPNLTGYVPQALEGRSSARPLAERELHLVYRGRPLPFWYGDLAREKMLIGQRMKSIADQKGVPTDIDWSEKARIYGPAWYSFLESGRATLGTESGSNVFDDRGEIKRQIMAALKEDPALTYQEMHRRFIAPHEGKVIMNQISPRVFEAIACRTALVLFEGSYSGVVRPNEHFIPLKKDFSNVDEVLARVADDREIEGLTSRAYRDIVASGRYSYRSFAENVGRILAARLRRVSPEELLLGVSGAAGDQGSHLSALAPGTLPASAPQEIKRPSGMQAKLDGYTLKSASKSAYGAALDQSAHLVARAFSLDENEVEKDLRGFLLWLRGKKLIR